MTEPHGIRIFADSDVVMAAVRRGGGCDATEFLQKLERRYLARFQRYFERLRDGTPIQSPAHIRRLSHTGTEPNVFELKADKYRLYIVKFHSRWFATHGRVKPKDNRVGDEIAKALTIFWENNGETA